MIKRFYKRGYGGDSSDSSSSASDSDSDSDSDPIPQIKEEEEKGELEENQQGDDEITVERDGSEIKKNKKEKKRNKWNLQSPSTGSGYESKDSSAKEVKMDSSGASKADTKHTGQGAPKAWDRAFTDLADCILRRKAVLKCRLCPKIVLLNEESVKTHLFSKRHARSKKHLAEGRLKIMFNSDGEIEEEETETHAERHARIMALAQKRLERANKVKLDESGETPDKKLRKNED